MSKNSQTRTGKLSFFADYSFKNNQDFSAELGHVIFIADGDENVAPISLKCYKFRRITRSAISGEVIDFSDMSDIFIALSKELEVILNKLVPVQLFTVSKSLFGVIFKSSRTSEKPTMLDITTAQEASRDGVISDIAFLRIESNIADGLIKSMSQELLRKVITTGILSIQPDQWIITSTEVTWVRFIEWKVHIIRPRATSQRKDRHKTSRNGA